jgi:hypothetical protein
VLVRERRFRERDEDVATEESERLKILDAPRGREPLSELGELIVYSLPSRFCFLDVGPEPALAQMVDGVEER